MDQKCPASKVFYGGQAVIEGVMMRGPTRMAIAVRRPDDEIVLHSEALQPWIKRHPVFSWPVVRGVVALFETLAIGITALMFSANQSAETKEEELSKGEMVFTVAFGVGMAVLIFMVLPTVLMGWVHKAVGNAWANLVEGLLRVAFLIIYVAAISLMKDIQRVLQYHGAEHKVINTYENGLEVTLENARRQSTLHRRCGTSFLFFVMIVSVVVFAFLGWPDFWTRILSRVALMPVIAGLSYEVLKWTGSMATPWLAWITYPGLWLQRFTTREPDDAMLEVAIAALAGAQDEELAPVIGTQVPVRMVDARAAVAGS